MSHVTCHMSHVTRYMLHVTCDMSQIQAVRIVHASRCCTDLSHVTRLWQKLDVSLLQGGCGGGDTQANTACVRKGLSAGSCGPITHSNTHQVPCHPTPTQTLTHSLRVHNQRLLLRNQREFRFWIVARHDRRRLAVDNSHSTNGK